MTLWRMNFIKRVMRPSAQESMPRPSSPVGLALPMVSECGRSRRRSAAAPIKQPRSSLRRLPPGADARLSLAPSPSFRPAAGRRTREDDRGVARAHRRHRGAAWRAARVPGRGRLRGRRAPQGLRRHESRVPRAPGAPKVGTMRGGGGGRGQVSKHHRCKGDAGGLPRFVAIGGHGPFPYPAARRPPRHALLAASRPAQGKAPREHCKQSGGGRPPFHFRADGGRRMKSHPCIAVFFRGGPSQRRVGRRATRPSSAPPGPPKGRPLYSVWLFA